MADLDETTELHAEVSRLDIRGVMPNQTGNWSDKSQLELFYLELENSMRKLIVDIVSPTLKKLTQQEIDLNMLRSTLTSQVMQMNDVTSAQRDVVEAKAMFGALRDEQSKTEVNVHNGLTRMNERQQGLELKIGALEEARGQDETQLGSLARGLERVKDEVGRTKAGGGGGMQDILEAMVEERHKLMHTAMCQRDVKIQGLEIQLGSLTDQLWGDETALVKFSGEVKKMSVDVAAATDAVKRIEIWQEETRAELGQRLGDEVEAGFGAHVKELQVLKGEIGNSVDSLREHLRTGLNTGLEELRELTSEGRKALNSYENKTEQFIRKIEVLTNQTQARFVEVDAELVKVREKSVGMANEQREVIQEWERRRKREKMTTELDLKQVQKRITAMFEAQEIVLRGYEKLATVSKANLEASKIQLALERQDVLDKQSMYLLGLAGIEDNKEEPDLTRRLSADGPISPPSLLKPPDFGASKLSPRKLHTSRNLHTSSRPGKTVLNIDDRCLSCSGQTPGVLKAFKAACLNYRPTAVPYNMEEHSRMDLMSRLDEILQNAGKSIERDLTGSSWHKSAESTLEGWQTLPGTSSANVESKSFELPPLPLPSAMKPPPSQVLG